MSIGAGLILDAVLIIIALVFVIVSAKRGFVRTSIELVGWVLVLYLAFTFSEPIADSVYNKFVKENVTAQTYSVVNESLSDNVNQTTEGIWNGLPAIVTSGAELLGIGRDSVFRSVNSAVSGGANAVAQSVSDNIISPIVIAVIRWIVFALIFALGMIVVRFLAVWLNRLFNFHFIGKLNRFLGGVLGLIKGALAVFLICIVLSLVIGANSGSSGIFSKNMLESSYIYNYFTQINPLFK